MVNAPSLKRPDDDLVNPKSSRYSNTPEEFAKRTNDDLIGLDSQLWAKEPEEISKKDKALFAGLKTTIGAICDLVTQVLNKTEIKDHHNFLDNLSKKDRGGKGMLTVSNHLHYLDDPLLIPALIDSRYLKSWQILLGDDAEYDDFKWTPADKTNFFFNKNPQLRKISRWIFGRTKTVPILRGQGLNQVAQQQLESFLRQGDWVHVFGEGTRTRNYGELKPFKPGIGRLVHQAPETLIVPFGHDGLQKVSPYGCGAEIVDQTTGAVQKHALKTGQRIQMVIGEPFTLEEEAKGMEPTTDNYFELAQMIRERVAKCHQEAIELNK